MKKRIISLILSLAMLLSVLPVNGLYAEDNEKTVLVYQTLTAVTENVNGAEDSEKVTVKVSGFLPLDAVLNVKPVSLSQDELVKYLGEEKADAINEVAAFDISISSDGKDFEPKDFGESVQVSVNPAMEAENDKIEVAHIETEEEPAKEVPTFVNASDDLVFSTNSFSTYIFYTVDFHYGDNDECVFSIEGGSSILLSELLAAIGYDKHTAAEITSVVFTNEDLIAVEELDGDWQLTSLAPFDTDEYLTVKFGEEELKVWVTDAVESPMINQNGVNMHLSLDNGVAAQKITGNVILPNGTKLTGRTDDGKTDCWVVVEGNDYWYEIVDYDYISYWTYTPAVSGAFGMPNKNCIATGTWTDLPGYKRQVTVQAYSTVITDSSNSYASIKQASEFVQNGDKVSRTVEIWLDGQKVQTVSNVVFPDRPFGGTLLDPSDNKGKTIPADIASVTPNNPNYVKRGDVAGAGATVVCPNNTTYQVHLLSKATVAYDANGGSNAPASQTKYYGVNINLSSNEPTRAGCTFLGWSTSKERADAGTVDYAKGAVFSENLTAGTTRTLYAAWDESKTTYTIHHKSSSGATLESDTTGTVSYTGSVDVASKVLNLTERGYQYSSSSIATITYSNNEATIVYAPIEYEIVYNLNFGTNNEDNPSKYTVETPTITLKNPTREGYTFAGWTEGSSIPQGSTGDKTFTATWTPSDYTISYDLDGGSLGTPNPTTYNVETETFTLNNPTKTGYTFKGWTGSNGNTPETTVTIEKGSTGNKSYVANFEPIEYTITYVLNDGTNNDANPEKYTIEDTPITLQDPTKLGYTFTGWKEGSSIPEGTTGDKTFTATWREDKVTYNYVAVCKDTVPEGTNFGSVSPTTEEVGKATGEPSSTATANAPTFKFVGWFDNAEGTGTALSTNATFEPSNKDNDGLLLGGTFYAVFEYNEAPYKVRHYLQNADDGKYELYETDEYDLSGAPYVGIIGQLTTKADAHPRTETGYEHYTAKPIAQQTIAADGSTYVDIYYDLDTAKVTYVVDGVTDNEVTYRYGQTIADYQASKEHYKFSGWFTENTYENAWTKPDTMGAADITVYGYFSLGSLTVSKSGMSDGETAIFTITGGNFGTTGFKIAVPNGGSVTIKDLWVDAEYTVTEDTNWSWRYKDIAGNAIEKTVSLAETIDGTASFVNVKTNKRWLDAFSIIKNVFNGSVPGSAD